jgi:transmembrane sensor
MLPTASELAMKTSEPHDPMSIPLTIRNEAAAWIMQLNAPDRTANTNAALRIWLAQGAVHREAFETAIDMWNAASTLPVSVAGRIAQQGIPERGSAQRPWLMAAAVAFVCLGTAAGIVNHFRDPSLATTVGEQRTLTLKDGTRVTLNTETRLTIAYDEKERRIDLDSGEAFFEVAKNVQRPFIVTVADRQVTALGTSFIVRHDDERTAVTLVEGKVSVAPLASSPARMPRSEMPITILEPGERLTINSHTPAQLDRPQLAKITAWKRGQAAFQNTPLPEAIAEMNRYSSKKLVIADASAAAVRVSGIFRVGESQIFALALANTYPLSTVEQGDTIKIMSIH